MSYELKKYDEMTDREKCARAVDILRLHRSDKSADDVVKYVVSLEKRIKELTNE